MSKNVNKLVLISMSISLCITISVAVIFAYPLFYLETVYYAFNDYSFLQENTSDSKYSEQQIEDLKGIITQKGYSVENATSFLVVESNPYLEFDMNEKSVNHVRINFKNPLKESLEVEIRYNEDNDLSENNKIYDIIQSEKTQMDIDIPAGGKERIELKLGSNIGQKFDIQDIQILNADISYTHFNHLLILEFVFLISYKLCFNLLRKGKWV